MLISCFVLAFMSVPPVESPKAPSAVAVETMRVPDGGIQPQVVVDRNGMTHLLYFKGEPEAGDLFYTSRTREGKHFMPALRVTSRPSTACAIGNDRGGKLAIGRHETVHVVWNAAMKDIAKDEHEHAPMFYARRVESNFERQRNLMTGSMMLDGGGDVIADEKGNVTVVWHALPNDTRERGETARRVFVTSSDSEGASFPDERAVSLPSSGVCGCCGLEAGVLHDGSIAILFRAATDGTDRGTHLLRSRDGGKTFDDTVLDHWSLNTCPMTTAAIASNASTDVIAWQSEKGIQWSRLGTGAPEAHAIPCDAGANCKYPAVAIDAAGRTLVAWTEGMGWNKGGRARWMVFDESGAAIKDASGSADGVPAWSLVAAFAKPDGGFVIVY